LIEHYNLRNLRGNQKSEFYIAKTSKAKHISYHQEHIVHLNKKNKKNTNKQ